MEKFNNGDEVYVRNHETGEWLLSIYVGYVEGATNPHITKPALQGTYKDWINCYVYCKSKK